MLLPKTAPEILAFAREHEVLAADLRFVDLSGQWRHVTVPLSRLSATSLSEGLIVSGTGAEIASDPTLPSFDGHFGMVFDVTSAKIDPFCPERTIALQGALVDTSLAPDRECTRSVLARALAHQRALGVLESLELGLEVEGSVFDEVRVSNENARASYAVDAIAGAWNRDREELPNLGHKNRAGHSWGRVGASDPLFDVRQESLRHCQELGLSIEHHEAGSATGQVRLVLSAQPPMRAADNCLWLRYVVKSVARRFNKTATFMPAPLADEAGNGLSLRIQVPASVLAKESEVFDSFCAGVKAHWPALCAFALATTNSYRPLARLSGRTKGLVSHGHLPHFHPRVLGAHLHALLVHSDSSANLYLVVAALLMAGLDGVRAQLRTSEMEPCATPYSLEASMVALASDREFLVASDVFSAQMIDRWLSEKRDEAEELSSRPHPLEIERGFHF
jgi:glutamine synthetase